MGKASNRHSDDDQLMLAYGRGNAAAFEELFRRYKDKTYSFFLRATGNRAVAEDLFQTTFLRLHRARKTYNGGSFRAFLFTVAANLLRDERARVEHRRRVDTAGEPAEALAESKQADSPEDLAEAAETRALLESAIAQLPAGLRDVLLLSRYQALNNAEVAAALGISPGAARVRLFRALTMMREKLGIAVSRHDEAGNE
jgi:RNA polymerase sigma-70 factor (ECF subfamily)